MEETTGWTEHLLHEFQTKSFKRYDYTNPYAWVAFAIGILFLFRSIIFAPETADVPTVGKRSKYEPWFWVRLRFFHDAWPIVREGYRNVSHEVETNYCGGRLIHLISSINRVSDL